VDRLLIFKHSKPGGFFIVELPELSEKSSFLLVMVLNDLSLIVFKPLYLVLNDSLDLHILYMYVVLDNGGSRLHVGEAHRMMLFDVLSNERGRLVAGVLHVQA